MYEQNGRLWQFTCSFIVHKKAGTISSLGSWCLWMGASFFADFEVTNSAASFSFCEKRKKMHRHFWIRVIDSERVSDSLIPETSNVSIAGELRLKSNLYTWHTTLSAMQTLLNTSRREKLIQACSTQSKKNLSRLH